MHAEHTTLSGFCAPSNAAPFEDPDEQLQRQITYLTERVERATNREIHVLHRWTQQATKLRDLQAQNCALTQENHRLIKELAETQDRLGCLQSLYDTLCRVQLEEAS